MAAKGFSPIAAIEANHILGTHRLPHRNGGGKHVFHRSLLTEPAKASVHGRDEVRKLICPDFMVS
jgi:hypothetical protein